MKNFTVTLKPDVSLEVAESGDPDGKPVFFSHGTPGSRHLFEPHTEDARRLGIRIISYSRPGYGSSTRSEGRKIRDAASDVSKIADYLDIEKFGVWGFSGGGPHALACAALLPERVTAAAILGGVAPYDAEGLDYFAGTGEFNIEDTKLLQSDPVRWEKKNLEEIQEMTTRDGESALEEFATLLSEVDRRALSEGMSDYMLTGMRDGCSNGVKGLMDDELAFIKPWGFDVSAVKVPTKIWHGKEDLFVPISHGRWIAGKIKGCETHFFDDEGHLSLFVKKSSDIMKWLSAHL